VEEGTAVAGETTEGGFLHHSPQHYH